MQPQYTPAVPIEDLIPCIDATGDCWEWMGSRDQKGYGSFFVKIDGTWRYRRAHRIVWLALVGSVPEGLTLDHLCRVRHCVNPDHLEWVTNRTNILRGYGFTALQARQTHCKYGHNRWRIKRTGRDCLECHRIASIDRRKRKRSE